MDYLLLFCQTTQNDPNKKPRNIRDVKKLWKKDSSRLKSISEQDKFGVVLWKFRLPHVNGEHFPELPKQIWWFAHPDSQIWLCGHRLLGDSIACAIIMEPMKSRANMPLYIWRYKCSSLFFSIQSKFRFDRTNSIFSLHISQEIPLFLQVAQLWDQLHDTIADSYQSPPNVMPSITSEPELYILSRTDSYTSDQSYPTVPSYGSYPDTYDLAIILPPEAPYGG